MIINTLNIETRAKDVVLNQELMIYTEDSSMI